MPVSATVQSSGGCPLCKHAMKSVRGRGLVLVAGVKADFAQSPQQAPKQAEFRAAGPPYHVAQKIERLPEGA